MCMKIIFLNYNVILQHNSPNKTITCRPSAGRRFFVVYRETKEMNYAVSNRKYKR